MQEKNFVPMPTTAATHIQKTAPAPPWVTAMATPPMLPTPIVAASAVDRAWKWLMWPGSSGESYLPSVTAVACPMWSSGRKRT